jgi:hypothetical protein
VFDGVLEVNGQTFHQTYIAFYGLWSVMYKMTTGNSIVPYGIW